MDQLFYDTVENSPVIAAVKDMNGLEKCCELEDVKVVFILFGDICTISGIVEKLKKADKLAMVHVDLISGLSPKEVAVDFIRNNTLADGIISTKPVLIKRAKELSMFTVWRVFLIDSMALENLISQHSFIRPNFIEIMPGLMPKVIKKIRDRIKVPVIAGGLISDKESVMAALDAGAISVSTTNQEVWQM